MQLYADFADGLISEVELPVEVLWVGSGQPGYLVVPGRMSKERWEAAAADEALIAETRASLEAWWEAVGLDPRPEPAKETPTQSSPTSRSTRPKPDNPVTAMLKSLAGTRKLRR